MLRGLNTAVAGMITQQRRQDAITNNIANLETPGFKQVNAVARSFPEMLVQLQGGGSAPRQIGRLNTGIFNEETVLANLKGDLTETHLPTDMALTSDIKIAGVQFDASGKGFSADGTKVFQPQAYFTVVDKTGKELYTRNGKFAVDAVGNLVTADGAQLVGQDHNPIVLDRPMSDVKILANGEFKDALSGNAILNPNGTPIQLLLSRIENPNNLVRVGNGNYKLEDTVNPAVPVAPNDSIGVHQGFIERSNVDASQSMVDMMSAMRAYEANQKVVQFYDRSMDKAVNEVGKV